MIKSYLIIVFVIFLFFSGCGLNSGSSSGTGTAGSKSKFTIVDNHLYIIENEQMNIFDITDPNNVYSTSKITMPFDIETIYPYKNYLYIGGMNGMYIYDNSTPTQPTKIADFIHVRSCDPVVVQDDIAYVTLNTNLCDRVNTSINRLEVIDVSTPSNPTLIKTLDMYAPGGLAIDDNKLFICDGEDGLKVFDVNVSENNNSKSVQIISLERKHTLNCYDIIAHQDNLVVSDEENVSQYDYSTIPMLKLSDIK